MRSARHDVVVRGGTLFDGSGEPPRQADLAIDGELITIVGHLSGGGGRLEIDARGLAVAPGFINVLSWATESLIEDGRSQSDLRQGVTLEVFGEGESMGPLTDAMRERLIAEQGDIQFDVPWTTLGDYLEHLEQRGTSTNVASFVGATTVRIHEVGYDDRPATEAELARMRSLVRAAMAEGALGVGSSLIYAPACFAPTDELIALASEAAAGGGMYISHIRDEGAHILEAVTELIDIARRARSRAEIYHLKTSGPPNWHRIGEAIELVEDARADGLSITADMYPYAASGTGLDATMPRWVQEGGLQAWIARLRRPEIRARVAEEMRGEPHGWENELLGAGGPNGVLLVGFRSDRLKALTGRTLAEVATSRGISPEEAAIDLVVEDESRVECVYFNQSEDVVRTVAALPWVSIGSDEASQAPEGVFLASQPHPRAYGSFARFLGRYVRDLGLLPLEEGVRRLAAMPAATLGLDRRGRLVPGAFADVVVFDPSKVQDHGTYAEPHRYSTGVHHVFVNGVHSLSEGEHTGAMAGRFVRGPGWQVRNTA